MKQTYVALYATGHLARVAADDAELRPELGTVHAAADDGRTQIYNFDLTRFQQGVRSTVYRNAPAGLHYPGDSGFPTQAGMHKIWSNVGPRVGPRVGPAREAGCAVRASYGRSFDFVNARFH